MIYLFVWTFLLTDQLDSDSYEVRRSTQGSLYELGFLALPALWLRSSQLGLEGQVRAGRLISACQNRWRSRYYRLQAIRLLYLYQEGIWLPASTSEELRKMPVDIDVALEQVGRSLGLIRPDEITYLAWSHDRFTTVDTFYSARNGCVTTLRYRARGNYSLEYFGGPEKRK